MYYINSHVDVFVLCCFFLPLHAVQLVPVFPGHQQTSAPSPLHRKQQHLHEGGC